MEDDKIKEKEILKLLDKIEVHLDKIEKYLIYLDELEYKQKLKKILNKNEISNNLSQSRF